MISQYGIVPALPRRSSRKRRTSAICAAVDSLDTIEEARVGVFTDFGPMPTEAQLSSVLLLAEMATVRNPSIEIAFGAGTSPFAPAIIEKQLVFSLEPAT